MFIICVFVCTVFETSDPDMTESSLHRSQLTQQDEDAGQDGDERPAAQAGGEAVGLGVAGHDVALAVAAAHADGQRAGAGLHRLLAVRDGDGQVEHRLVLVGPAAAPRQDPRRVVWRGKARVHFQCGRWPCTCLHLKEQFTPKMTFCLVITHALDTLSSIVFF